jgi:hypothetical protein
MGEIDESLPFGGAGAIFAGLDKRVGDCATGVGFGAVNRSRHPCDSTLVCHVIASVTRRAAAVIARRIHTLLPEGTRL